uniref:two-component system response regulator n=1 Tax=Cellvibrio fontiphilus TaxID=1815559 RepID=UPI002B4BDCC1|nr:EAL domain-containing protein [Cellvibrio fontiphilus]
MQVTTVVRPVSLLVIEDDDVDSEKIKRLLRKGALNISLTTVTSAQQARELIAKQQFDCAILDYRLQDSLGTELLQQIKHHKQNPTPVIMISGNSDERIIADVMREGAFDYIPKRQLDTETLISVLESSFAWADQARLQQEDLARFHNLAEGLPHLAWTCTPEGDCDYLNQRWCDYTGVAQQAQIGSGWINAVHPDDRDYLASAWKEAVEEKQEMFVKFRIRRHDGIYRWFDTRALPQKNEQGKVVRWLGTNTDINEMESTRLALAYSEQLFHAAFDYAPLGMVLINMHGQIIQTNPALRHLLGYDTPLIDDTPPAKSLMKISDLFTAEEITSALIELEKLYLDNKLFTQYETRFQAYDGSNIPVMINAAFIKEFSGEPCYLLQIYDLSERKRYEHQLLKLAHFDSLTGLGNREKMNREIDFLIRKASRTMAPFAVVFGDLDHFKQINDGLGHEAGDILLKTVARRLERCLRHEDVICRLGGDEFVILLPDIPRFEAVVSVADKLLQKIHRPIRLGKNRVHVGMSFGIALYPTDGDDAKTLLRNADSALYDAKARGRGCYQLYRKELTEYVHNRLQLDADLRKAIINNEFELHYQPVIDLDTHKVTSVEALIRWNHPQRGRVAPDEFIPYAQESGLILPMGKWIINEACRQLAHWRKQGMAINMSINVSARQFMQQDLVAQFESMLTQYQLMGNQITIEITEQMFLENTENNLKQINELKALGIKISLDDFGIGYSSLSYILRFAPQYLKIDRSFVSLIGTGKEHDEMVNAIIGLNKIIPMQIVGEGIEEEQQRYFLQARGCDFGQGYYFSRPLPAPELEQFIQRQLIVSDTQRAL